jgi:hypothetical protein
MSVSIVFRSLIGFNYLNANKGRLRGRNMAQMKTIYTDLAVLNQMIKSFMDNGYNRAEQALNLGNAIMDTNYDLCSRCNIQAGLTYDDQTLCVGCEEYATEQAYSQLKGE